MEEWSKWVAKYSELEGRVMNRDRSEYTDQAKAIFSRYNVLGIILNGLEEIDSDNLPDMVSLKKLLLEKGRSQNSIFTENPKSEIEARAMSDERDKFCAFVDAFKSEAGAPVVPLFYRRALSKEEVEVLWEKIFDRWGADGGYWYPLAQLTESSLFAFNANAFGINVPLPKLRQMMSDRGITRLFELRESREDNYRLEVENWAPCYSGSEGYWISDKLDWILYISHESSVTTGGWLTDEVFKVWPPGRDHPWCIPSHRTKAPGSFSFT